MANRTKASRRAAEQKNHHAIGTHQVPTQTSSSVAFAQNVSCNLVLFIAPVASHLARCWMIEMCS